MQHILKNHQVDSSIKNIKNDESVIDGKYIACKFKYIQQFRNTNYTLHKIIPYSKISTINFYKKYKKVFDIASQFLTKYNIDIYSFLKFFILVDKNSDNQINEYLINRYTFKKYFDYLAINKKYKKIYLEYIKTMNFIVDECIKNELFSIKDFLRKTIKEKTFGNYFISGKISKHFLASIPNFNKIIPKLDYFSQLELKCIADKYYVYNTEINNAFLMIKNIKANPIEMTDILLFNKRKNK